MLSSVRSRHLAGKHDIPAGQKARLITSFGGPDPTFVKAGLNLPKDLPVALLRTAAQDVANIHGSLSRALTDIESRVAVPILSKLFGGFLLFNEELENADQEIDSIEGLILNAPDEVYLSARHTSRTLNFDVPALKGILFPAGSLEDVTQAAVKARLAVRHDPRFAFGVFALLLRVGMQLVEPTKP